MFLINHKKTYTEAAEAAEFERSLAELQNILHEVEREVLKSLLIKAGGDVEQAVKMYGEQQFRI